MERGNDEIHDFYTRKVGVSLCTGAPLLGTEEKRVTEFLLQ